MPQLSQFVGLSPYISIGDLAQIMSVSTRTVKRIYIRVGVPPTVNGPSCHRWSFRDASRLLRAWEAVNRQSIPTLQEHQPKARSWTQIKA